MIKRKRGALTIHCILIDFLSYRHQSNRFLIGQGHISFTRGANLYIIPDIMFGFTHEQIQLLMWHQWSSVDRQAYVWNACIDLFVYMESYTLGLSVILYYLASRRRGWNPETVCLVSLPILLFDLVETTLMLQAARTRTVSVRHVAIASYANQLKWSSAGLVIILILYARLALQEETVTPSSSSSGTAAPITNNDTKDSKKKKN